MLGGTHLSTGMEWESFVTAVAVTMEGEVFTEPNEIIFWKDLKPENELPKIRKSYETALEPGHVYLNDVAALEQRIEALMAGEEMTGEIPEQHV